jgi:hypothetical protein
LVEGDRVLMLDLPDKPAPMIITSGGTPEEFMVEDV